jgi:hypothetical protein
MAAAMVLTCGLVDPVAAADQPQEPASAQEIDKLVGQLGEPNSKETSQAKKRLAAIGMRALPALRRASFQDTNKPQRAQAEAVIKQITEQARQALITRLGKRNKAAVIAQVTDPEVARAFPEFLAFAVRYPLYPVAVRPPAPLKQRNLFLVDRDGQMDYLFDFQGLNDFFREHIGKQGLKKETVKMAIHAWLAMSQEFSQDGFLTFTITGKDIQVGTGAAGLKGTGRAVIKPAMGNKGFIEVTMLFGLTGELDGIKENKRIIMGIRPK